jgi:hypothetical protein
MALSQTPGQLQHTLVEGRDPSVSLGSGAGSAKDLHPRTQLTGMAREETSTQEGQVGATDSGSSSGRRNGATFQKCTLIIASVMPPKFIIDFKYPPSCRQTFVLKNLCAIDLWRLGSENRGLYT